MWVAPATQKTLPHRGPAARGKRLLGPPRHTKDACGQAADASRARVRSVFCVAGVTQKMQKTLENEASIILF